MLLTEGRRMEGGENTIANPPSSITVAGEASIWTPLSDEFTTRICWAGEGRAEANLAWCGNQLAADDILLTRRLKLGSKLFPSYVTGMIPHDVAAEWWKSSKCVFTCAVAYEWVVLIQKSKKVHSRVNCYLLMARILTVSGQWHFVARKAASDGSN